MRRRVTACVTFGFLSTALLLPELGAYPPPDQVLPGIQASGAGDRSRWVTAGDPKPLSANVLRGLSWLVEHQHENGGWSQGEESLTMGGGSLDAAKPNVGDTCAATLALIRSGSTPSKGTYAPAIFKALGFIMKQVESSDYTTLSVTDENGTRLQSKLGPHIDTFLALLVLVEAAGHMPDKESENRLASALDKVLYKIQNNQQADGLWGGGGWAPALANAVAAKSLNRARQVGMEVKDDVLAKAEGNALLELKNGALIGGAGGAGVALYSGAKNLGILQDSVNSNRERRAEFERLVASATTPELRQQAQQILDRFDAAEVAFDAAQRVVVDKLNDPQFVAGFGSNGGEEFLSYMNIGESLVVKGGEDWTRWDAQMTGNMNRIQNADGTWTGHHCITGRTFCTSAALMVLMVDRTPVPPEALAASRTTGAPGDDPRP